MRILVLTNLYPNPYQPNRGIWHHHRIKALAEHHEVSVIAPILWTEELRCRLQQGRQLAPHRQAIRDGVTVSHPRYLYPPKVLRSSYGTCYRWSVAKTFQRAIRDLDPNVVYATWAYPDGLAAVQLCKQLGLPVAVKVCGSDIHQLDLYPARIAGTVHALVNADAVVAVSTDLSRKVVELGADKSKVHVVYNGVDSDLFCPGCRFQARERLGLASDKQTLLFVGNLVPVKGLDILLGACSKLANRAPSFQCHIIGDGPLRSTLERTALHAGLTHSVIFHGAKPQSELPDWYRAADIVVLPSYSEGIPNVLLEASACGRPFIATRVGGIPELPRSGMTKLVPPGSIAELANAIESSLASLGAAENGITPPESRTHEAAGQELATIFEQLVRTRSIAQNARRIVAGV